MRLTTPMISCLSVWLATACVGSSGGGAAAGGTGTGTGTGTGSDAGSTGGTDTTGSGTAVNAYPSGAPVPIDQLETTLADVMCKLLVACQDSMLGKNGFATAEGCMAIAGGNFGANSLVALVKAGKVKYDATAAGKCMQAMGANCGSVSKSSVQSAACKATFTGTVAEGGACSEDEECASQNCDQQESACPGKCDKARVAAGGACTLSQHCEAGLGCVDKKCGAQSDAKVGEPCHNNACANGSYCAFEGGDKPTCKAAGGADAKCNGSEACTPEFYCKKTADVQNGTCAPRPKAGEACAASMMGDGIPCLESHVCVAGTNGKGTCQPRVKFGGACSVNAQCMGVDLACVGGACKLLPKKGEACTPPDMASGKYITCMPPTVCNTGKCDDAPGDGKPCASFQCAKGLTCVQSVCKKPPAKGEECQGQCQEGLDCKFDDKGKGTCQAPVCGAP